MKIFLQKSKIYSFIAFVCFFLCSPSLSVGQTWDEIIKLTASDGDEGDSFGFSVAIEGDIAVVSGHGNDGGFFTSDNAGSAYVFRRVGDFWIEEVKLTASDAEGNELFGRPVAIDSNRIAIVATQDNDFKGSVYVFEYIDEEWIETAYLVGSDSEPGDYFGYSIDIGSDRIVIGAIQDDDDGSNSGSVYVFELITEEFWIETEKLTASDAAAGDLFGSTVAISGDHIIIGAYGNDDDGSFSGSAYVFELITEEFWIETQKLTASDAAAFDYFGIAVAISSDYILTGASRNDDHGSAYVFELVDDVWTETQKLTASDADELDSFGTKLSIGDDNIIIGAQGNDDDGLNSGSAYVFDLEGDTWIETQKLTASDAYELDGFGSVAISGDHIIIGASGNDDDGSLSGSAYIFSTCPTLPEVEIEIEDTELCNGDTLTLTATGADTYFWEGDVEDGEPFVPEIGEYTYTVTGADDAGCENTASIDITVHGLPEVTGTADDPVVCEGDEVTLTGSGASTYLWDGGVIDGEAFTPDFGTTEYTVIGTDDFGCENTSSVAVVVYEAISISFSVIPELMGDDGSIDITVSGGLPAYSFDWDNDGTGDFDDDEDLTGLTEGTYIVVVMCDAGCNGTEVIEVGSTQASIETNNERNLSVSPNPTSDLVTIKLEGSFVYSLVGVNGAVLATKKSVNQAQLDLSEFANGIYFLEIQSENGSETVKLVKQ